MEGLFYKTAVSLTVQLVKKSTTSKTSPLRQLCFIHKHTEHVVPSAKYSKVDEADRRGGAVGEVAAGCIVEDPHPS